MHSRELHDLFDLFPMDRLVTVRLAILAFRFRIVRAFLEPHPGVIPKLGAFRAQFPVLGIVMVFALGLDKFVQKLELFFFCFVHFFLVGVCAVE